MFPTIPTQTTTLALEDLVARFAAHDVVDGVVVMGSASTGTLNPTSDYDLFAVLSQMPAPLRLVLTTVDRRLTEVYFATTAAIDRILSIERPTPGNLDEALHIQWLQSGHVVFDRSGRLGQARRKVQTEAWIDKARANELAPADMYAYWWKINYNLRQTRRMLMSDDPAYLIAVDIRLLYSLPEVFVGYARARNVPWRGEKELIRYLMRYDRVFLDMFRQCLAEIDRERKARLYEQLAALALAPVGGLWDESATAVQLDPGAAIQPGAVEAALTFWDDLAQPKKERYS